MGKIDTSEWKEFRIKDLFETQKKGNKLQVPTGASVPVQDLLEDGATPRITVTGSNNGIFGFYDYCGKNIADYRVFNNFVSVSFLGTVFYQEGDATLDMKVHCLKPQGITLNKYTGRFLVGAIRASLRESTYSDQISSSILPEMSIKLPVTNDGAPDWAYMESYMANLETKVAKSLTLLQAAKDAEKKKLDTREWASFALGALFNIVKGKRLTKAEMKSGETPFIGSSALNNGCTAMIGNDKNQHPENTITVCYNGSVGETFYQNKPYIASDDVNVFYPKFTMNRQIALFIVPLIKGVSSRYDYIDKWKKEAMEADKIYLPVDKTGQPDWAYMEEYMRKVEEKVKNVLNCFEEGKDDV